MFSQKYVSMVQGIHSEIRVLISKFTHISLRGDLNLDRITQGNEFLGTRSTISLPLFLYFTNIRGVYILLLV